MRVAVSPHRRKQFSLKKLSPCNAGKNYCIRLGLVLVRERKTSSVGFDGYSEV